MADFTMYGISVPPLQLEWLTLGRVATPNASGVVAALCTVAAGLDPVTRKQAMRRFRADLSIEAVGKKMQSLLELSKPKLTQQLVGYEVPIKVKLHSSSPSPHFPPNLAIADHTHQEHHLTESEWTVVASDTHVVDVSAIEHGIRTASNKNTAILVFQTLDTSNQRIPTIEHLTSRRLTSLFVCAVRTSVLRIGLKISDNLDTIIQTFILSPSYSVLIPIELAGIGAVRVPGWSDHPGKSKQMLKQLRWQVKSQGPHVSKTKCKN